jgi:hypothetical protein
MFVSLHGKLSINHPFGQNFIFNFLLSRLLGQSKWRMKLDAAGITYWRFLPVKKQTNRQLFFGHRQRA